MKDPKFLTYKQSIILGIILCSFLGNYWNLQTAGFTLLSKPDNHLKSTNRNLLDVTKDATWRRIFTHGPSLIHQTNSLLEKLDEKGVKSGLTSNCKDKQQTKN